jgi:hypothetical protein
LNQIKPESEWLIKTYGKSKHAELKRICPKVWALLLAGGQTDLHDRPVDPSRFFLRSLF